MAKKSLSNFYADNDIKLELDQRAINDPNFNRSLLINNLLKSYFAADLKTSESKDKILKEIHKAKSDRVDIDNRLMSLSIKLTQVHEQEQDQIKEDDKNLQRDILFLKHNRSEMLREDDT